ncbi:flagellar motor switch protein FliM [Modestobacter muralis]|uniref:Flagellar motor switch protein FliM n=1 Tax=Modestobacter muralis TaxID=1608614 RepID=A0A6P0H7J9_9ACTN|nr:flagellar motor switch protein FliM [Modestobacter muralis]NEN51787.1 flagellar motor switch protein FliM [Modestobacter muralis]
MSLSDIAADAPSVPAPRSPEGQGRSRRRVPRTYDFRRPTKLSREHVRILQIAQENFARQATTTLTSMLRTGARMELVGIEQFSYDDYIATLPPSYFLAVFTLEPLPGKGLLAYPLETAMAIVDHMLGGSGEGEQPVRPMTGMESAITGHLLDRLLGELAEAFAHITPLQPVIDGVEYNPQLAQAASGSETVMVGTYSLRIGEREPEATLVLPFAAFAPALTNAASPQLSESARHKRQRAFEALTERLNDVPVDVSVRFNPIVVPSGDLLSLAEGDVLLLRHSQDTPLEVTTNDVVFAQALPSNHRRRLAAEIVPETGTGEQDHR